MEGSDDAHGVRFFRALARFGVNGFSAGLLALNVAVFWRIQWPCFCHGPFGSRFWHSVSRGLRRPARRRGWSIRIKRWSGRASKPASRGVLNICVVRDGMYSEACCRPDGPDKAPSAPVAGRIGSGESFLASAAAGNGAHLEVKA